MSVNDIIKKSFLAEFDGGIDYASILPAVAAALILGLSSPSSTAGSSAVSSTPGAMPRP